MQSYQGCRNCHNFSSLNSAEKRNLSRNDGLATKDSDSDVRARDAADPANIASSARPAFLPSGRQSRLLRAWPRACHAGAPVECRRSAAILHLEPVGQRIAVVDEDRVVAGHARPALDRGDDGVVGARPSPRASTRPLNSEPMMLSWTKSSPTFSLPMRRPLRHAGRGAGAAGRAVDRLVAVEHGIAGMRLGLRRLAGPQDMATGR